MKFLKHKKNNTLIIADTHLPFDVDEYIDFLKDVQKEFKCNTTVHIGDFCDNHAISFHSPSPDGRSPGDELKLVRQRASKYFKAFPDTKVCKGNHDELPYRKAYAHGISKQMIKTYNEFLNAPDGWQWGLRWEIDGVQYLHGTGFSGKNAALSAAERHRQSTVIGHVHSYAGIQYSATFRDLIFGMNVGCGLDNDKYAFEYGKYFPNKPIVSCGVVVEGKYPFLLPMDLGTHIKSIRNENEDIKEKHSTIAKNFMDLTKAELKMILDKLGITYRVKERRDELIKMAAYYSIDENRAPKYGGEAEKKQWWKMIIK